MALNRLAEDVHKLINQPQHRPRLSSRIIWLEIFKVLDFFFNVGHLFRQATSNFGQGFADMVGELLIQDFLKIGRAHSRFHMAVARVREEEFTLSLDRILDISTSLNIALENDQFMKRRVKSKPEIYLQHRHIPF